MKAYLSRVGESPLPSEMHGNEAEALREKGGEYGTTTGRPRRVGWLDSSPGEAGRKSKWFDRDCSYKVRCVKRIKVYKGLCIV